MKKLISFLILLAVVGGGAYYYFVYNKAVAPPQIVQTTITRGTVTEVVQATGTLEAIRTVQVGPQVSGTIMWLGPDFNSIVREGEVIARLDPSLLQVQVDIQTANIERQETDIQLQRVQLEDATRTFDRTTELFEKGLANQTQLEQAELAIKSREAQIASAEKSLVQARANLAQARLNVSYTEVKSPINGVVVNRLVDIGQSVQSSMNITPFYQIATDLTNLRLTAGVDEAEIGKIRQGMDVTFQVDTYPNSTFRGRVETVRLNASTQNNVVTYPVWIDVPNGDLRLRPSLTATLRIILNTANDVVRVPAQALRFRPTADMFTALGLTPPEPPAGGRLARGGQAPDAAVSGPPAAAGAPEPARGGQGPQAPPAAGQGQTRGGGQPAAGGEGRAGRGNFANLSPEERQRMIAAGGGRNGGRGGRGAAAAPAAAAPVGTNQKIDSMFMPTQVRPQQGQVWTWDEVARSLTAVPVTTGIFDNQFSQLLSGELTEGQQVVTNIVLPLTAAQNQNQQQSIFGQQGGRGGFGGGGGRGGGRGGF